MESELTGLDWLNTVTLSLAALEVDPAKSARRTRPWSACSFESGYTSSSSDSADEVSEVLRSDAASKEAWERAKRSSSAEVLPLQSVIAVAIAHLKGTNGSPAEKIVDYIRKSIPYYSKIARGSLLNSVNTTLRTDRHFQTVEKGGRALWTCSRRGSKSRKERRRRSSPSGKRKNSSTTSSSQAKLKSRSSATKSSKSSDSIVVVSNAVDALLAADAVAMVPDESADSLLLAISGDDSGEEVDMPTDLFDVQTFDVAGESPLDSLPSLSYDVNMDGLNDLAFMLDSPPQAWLPTAYIPGPIFNDDTLCMC